VSDEEMQPEEPQDDRHGTRRLQRRDARARTREEKDEKEEGARQRDEKEEKEEEGEGWTRDPLGGIIWALILIVAGLILLAQSTFGLIQWHQFGGVWNLVLVAVGLILLFEVAVRLLIPAYRRPIGRTLIFAFFVLAIGLGGFTGWSVIWPLFLILMGIVVLLSGLLKGRF